MNLPKFQRKHLYYLAWAAAVTVLAFLIWLNFDYSKVNLLGIFSFWMPNALIWALFFLGGAGLGYFFCKWEKKLRKRKRNSLL